jgi:hypothetical protein
MKKKKTRRKRKLKLDPTLQQKLAEAIGKVDPKLQQKLTKRIRKLDPKLAKQLGEKIRKLEREKEPCDAAEAKPQDYVRDIDGTFVGFHGFLPGAKLSEQQLQAERRRVLQRSLFPPLPRRPVRSAKTILYCGKLDQIWGSPLGAAKWIAEEIRTDPWVGWRLLAQQEKLHWKEKGYVLKMWRTLIKYLADQKPLFREMDYQIADIVQQHPDYTIQEITSALYEQDPKRKWDQRKWDTLERYVRRFLKNVPRL